jgi:hypothetical protein
VSDDATLQYPSKITDRIGLSVKNINAMKSHGCRFLGRKTSVVWVREHLDRITSKQANGHAPSPSERPQRSIGSKRGG